MKPCPAKRRRIQLGADAYHRLHKVISGGHVHNIHAVQGACVGKKLSSTTRYTSLPIKIQFIDLR